MRYNLVLLIAIVLAITTFSCREKGSKYINQGEIHYNIEYIGNFGMSKEVMPKTMVVSFKNDKILLEMVSPFGNSGIVNLANPEEGIFDTYFSLFTMRYYYAAKPGEMYPGFEAMDGIEIKKTSKTTIICGFNCKSAEVTFPSDRTKSREIWYTNEINVRNTNASTPYHEIDGVLMNFFFLMGNTELQFNAETVYKKDIPDETFARKDKFQRVTKEGFGEIIKKMRGM